MVIKYFVWFKTAENESWQNGVSYTVFLIDKI